VVLGAGAGVSVKWAKPENVTKPLVLLSTRYIATA